MSSGVTIANLTIRDVYYHAIMLAPGTESPRIQNVRLIDAGRQFVKAYPDGKGGGVDDGSDRAIGLRILENVAGL